VAALSSRAHGPGPVSGRGLPAPSVAAALLLAVLFVATQYPGASTVPFVGDDYFVLEKTRDAAFGAVWSARSLISHYYRPWARELHFWVLQRLFGTNVTPFHLAGAGLWLAVITLYFALVRRLAGPGVAALAAAAVAGLAGWGVLLVWTVGAQDLWMICFGLCFLHALERGRVFLACALLAAALLSKETAALLPGLALAHALLLARLSWGRALRRVAPMLLVVLAWGALHPLLGGRLWWPRAEPVLPGLHPPFGQVALGTLLALFNLGRWPRPEPGWSAVLPRALLGILLLAGFAAWGLWTGRSGAPRTPRPDRARVAAFGTVWALLGWLPLSMPTLGWHSYYTLLGALGAWLALAVGLARLPWAGVMMVSVLAIARAGLAVTPSEDWGTEWFQRRAAVFTAHAHDALLRLRPELPRGSRVFFAGVPGASGLIAGGEESPALRFWYRDGGLRVATFDRYRVRAPGDVAGADVFFRFDPESGWREVLKGGAGGDLARADAPRWRADHERLAVALARGGDWAGAAAEYDGLARAFPADATFPYCAGLALAAQGDSLEATRWIRRAAALPSADAEMRAAARALAPRAGSAGPR
jgi:hypothetical protein